MTRKLLFLLACVITAAPAAGATITAGDVTTSLAGDLFFDDARTGGGDQTINDVNGAGAPLPPANIQRYFDFDNDGSILDMAGPGTVTIQGFGFATSAAAAANDAVQIELTFIYLGADENPGTAADNVLLGSETVGYTHTGGGEYFVNFDTDISGFIDGVGSRFRVVVDVLDTNPNLQETIRFKTRPIAENSFNGQKLGHSGAALSISGTFVPIPEPGSAALTCLAAMAMAAYRRR